MMMVAGHTQHATKGKNLRHREDWTNNNNKMTTHASKTTTTATPNKFERRRGGTIGSVSDESVPSQLPSSSSSSSIPIRHYDGGFYQSGKHFVFCGLPRESLKLDRAPIPPPPGRAKTTTTTTAGAGKRDTGSANLAPALTNSPKPPESPHTTRLSPPCPVAEDIVTAPAAAAKAATTTAAATTTNRARTFPSARCFRRSQ